MKFSRIFFSALTGLLTSLTLALTFFHYSLPSLVDRLFLVLVPALAFGILYHQTFPAISAWICNLQSQTSKAHFSISFLCYFNLTYGAIGFLREVLQTPFGMFIFAVITMTIGTTPRLLPRPTCRRVLSHRFPQQTAQHYPRSIFAHLLDRSHHQRFSISLHVQHGLHP